MAETSMRKPLAKSPPPPTTAVTATEPGNGKPLTMRGRKRHKCAVCGNIARSRCPFFSCKGCCVKAGNACHIHVLKPSLAGESIQVSPAPLPSQGPTTSTTVRHPYDSLRLRTVKPSGLITKKEAAIMNSWRFRKLRAYLQDMTAHEDEAFDRYMQNNLLLEELFNVNRAGSPDGQGQVLMAKPTSDKDIDVPSVLACLRVRQRLNSKKREAHKQRLKRAIDRSLQKVFHKGEESDDFTENEDIYLSSFPARRELKRMKIQSAEGKDRLRRMEIFTSLVEKVKVVDNQEDFDLCLKTLEENFGNCNTFAAVRQESTAQAATFKEQTPVGADNSEKAESSASEIKLNASFNQRVDLFGVMKEIRTVDADEYLFDSSNSCVESL